MRLLSLQGLKKAVHLGRLRLDAKAAIRTVLDSELGLEPFEQFIFRMS
jgi:hypothetical protein